MSRHTFLWPISTHVQTQVHTQYPLHLSKTYFPNLSPSSQVTVHTIARPIEFATKYYRPANKNIRVQVPRIILNTATYACHWFKSSACFVLDVLEVLFYLLYFYRAMHYSTKRSLAIACRPSVRLSVCDVGESGRPKFFKPDYRGASRGHLGDIAQLSCLFIGLRRGE